MLNLIFSLIRLGRKLDRPHYKKKSFYNPPPASTQEAFTAKAQSDAEIKELIHSLPKVDITWIVDGDTVIVSKGWSDITVRLDSIDCPEDGQPWGDIAKYGLIKLISGQTVYLEEHGIDVHGRTLGTLYIWNHAKTEWMNVNERMVTLGHAWVMYKFYDHLPQDRRDKLDRLEKWARSKKVGLWQASNPIPPWQWRRGG